MPESARVPPFHPQIRRRCQKPCRQYRTLHGFEPPLHARRSYCPFLQKHDPSERPADGHGMKPHADTEAGRERIIVVGIKNIFFRFAGIFPVHKVRNTQYRHFLPPPLQFRENCAIIPLGRCGCGSHPRSCREPLVAVRGFL